MYHRLLELIAAADVQLPPWNSWFGWHLQVFLHPKGHVIEADDVGLVICWDLGSAYAISKYGDQEMENKKWRRKKLVFSNELQKFRTGPIVDAAEDSGTAAHMSYTVAGNPETLESRMRSEISSRGFPERTSRHGGSQHGSSQHESSKHGSTDDTLESGEFLSPTVNSKTTLIDQ